MNDKTRRILRYAELDSTMDEARRLLAAGLEDGSVILADRQSSGRGRIAGRAWEAEEGSSLLMTMVIGRESARATALPLRIGLAVRRMAGTLANGSGASGGDTGVFRLKWPNDLVASTASGWRKIAGILCESTDGRVLAGVGINLRPQTFAPELADKAAALTDVIGIGPESLPDIAALAAALAEDIDYALVDMEWRDRINECLWMRGEMVEFTEGHPERGIRHRGRIEGVDAEGCLLLRENGGGLKSYASGELSGFVPG
ncbi:MAG: biotin--[acetyl-CoA-carboxylase] ligase [Rectinemataceae bacterium]